MSRLVFLAVLAAGCVHWSGPSRVAAPKRVLVAGERPYYGSIERRLLELFNRDPRYRAEHDRSDITSNDEACVLGLEEGADLVIWRTTKVHTEEMGCLDGTVVGHYPLCFKWHPGNLNEVDADVVVHAVTIDAQCTARDIFTGSAHREAAPRTNYDTMYMRRDALRDIARQLEPAFDAAFSTALTIAQTDGTTGAIADSPFRTGDTLRVLRDGEHVGDVVVSAAGTPVSKVQAFAGDVRLSAGDRLEAGDRWCCFEFGATSNLARVEVAGAQQWAASIGGALRWYAARSSPAFEFEVDRTGLAGTSIYRGTFGGGYRLWAVPRRLALLGTVGVGFAAGFRTFEMTRLQSTHPMAYARLGAQLRLLDWLWFNAALQVDTKPRHDGWHDVDLNYPMDAQDEVAFSRIGARLGLAVRY